MAVLAGNFPEAAWSKYQSLPLKTKACHEQVCSYMTILRLRFGFKNFNLNNDLLAARGSFWSTETESLRLMVIAKSTNLRCKSPCCKLFGR